MHHKIQVYCHLVLCRVLFQINIIPPENVGSVHVQHLPLTDGISLKLQKTQSAPSGRGKEIAL